MFPSTIVLDGTDLTPLQRRVAFRLVGYDRQPDPETTLAADAVFGIWLFMLVEKLQFLDPEQRHLLAEELVKALSPLGDRLLHSLDNGQTPMLVIADAQYATWHNHCGWLDLSNGEQVRQPAIPPLQTMGYNLEVLFHRNKAACESIIRRRVPNAAASS